MDFKALANEAIVVPVDGSKIVLKIPEMEDRSACMKTLMEINKDDDNVLRAASWDRIAAQALKATVTKSDDVNVEEWERNVVIARARRIPGFEDLKHAAMSLCGMDVRPLSDGAEDNVAKTEEALGNSPSE